MSRSVISVMDRDWDILIVLDACRYDFFSRLYSDYFVGRLSRGFSVGGATLEWCINSFRDFYPDVVYVSGNPYLNSNVEMAGFSASEHFHRVIDVWKYGWDDKLGTVPPETVSRAALDVFNRFPDKRFIIHYLQPHEPYLSLNFYVKGIPNPSPDVKSSVDDLTGSLGYRVAQLVMHRLEKHFIKSRFVKLWRSRLVKYSWRLLEFLNLPPATPMDAVRRTYGAAAVKLAYRENLKIVLDWVARLSALIKKSDPSKNIVITSDHGELLGEDGFYGHLYGGRSLHLLEIPWFQLDDVNPIFLSNTSTSVLKGYSSAALFDLTGHESLKSKIKVLKRSGKI